MKKHENRILKNEKGAFGFWLLLLFVATLNSLGSDHQLSSKRLGLGTSWHLATATQRGSLTLLSSMLCSRSTPEFVPPKGEMT